MYTLSAQTEQRNFEETRRRLELARELVLTFAMVKGKLPCPARSIATATPATTAGEEVNAGGTTGCVGDSVTDYYGGTSGGVTFGLLPARSIGFQQTDSSGFAVDAWNNRIRYAVAQFVESGTCTGSVTNPHFVVSANMKANGIGCQPGDLLICRSATGITSTACGGAANQIMSQNLVAAIIYSTGKNGATGGTGLDEAANLNGDRVFVYHAPNSSSAANGEFDDQFTWITVGELYGKLIAAGVLP